MQLILILSLFLLTACASTPSAPITEKPVAGIADASKRCTAKGFEKGSFEFDSCYRTSPEVEAFERNARLDTLGIIRKNRSVPQRNIRLASYSLPVE